MLLNIIEIKTSTDSSGDSGSPRLTLSLYELRSEAFSPMVCFWSIRIRYPRAPSTHCSKLSSVESVFYYYILYPVAT